MTNGGVVDALLDGSNGVLRTYLDDPEGVLFKLIGDALKANVDGDIARHTSVSPGPLQWGPVEITLPSGEEYWAGAEFQALESVRAASPHIKGEEHFHDYGMPSFRFLRFPGGLCDPRLAQFFNRPRGMCNPQEWLYCVSPTPAEAKRGPRSRNCGHHTNLGTAFWGDGTEESFVEVHDFSDSNAVHVWGGGPTLEAFKPQPDGPATVRQLFQRLGVPDDVQQTIAERLNA